MFTVPYNFFAGYVTGVVAPLAAIAAMVAAIRLFTGKVPFVTPIQKDDEGGDQQLSIRLVPSDEAAELYAEQKEQIGREFSNVKVEIQAVIEEGKSETQTAAEEEGSESPEA
jgi:hypothetical protein